MRSGLVVPRPDLVFGFLEEIIGRVSSLSMREGSKYLSDHQRCQLRAEFERR